VSSDTPRILDEAAARAYLGGRINPHSVMPPVKIGGKNCWDRKALDTKLDSLFGIAPHAAAKGEDDSPLARWRKGKSRGGENAA
jgi:hypothetical protein